MAAGDLTWLFSVLVFGGLAVGLFVFAFTRREHGDARFRAFASAAVISLVELTLLLGFAAAAVIWFIGLYLFALLASSGPSEELT